STWLRAALSWSPLGYRQSLKLVIVLIFALGLCAIALPSGSLAIALPSGSLAIALPQEHEKKAEEAPPSAYSGSETCQMCHEEAHKSYAQTAHFITTVKKGWKESEQGCEACHGPGREHADSGGDITKIFTFTGKSIREVNGRCLACHERQEERHNFRQSEHGVSQVSCTDCHAVHPKRPIEGLLVTKGPDLCITCHQEKLHEFRRPFHHRVMEGGMGCVDCHNEHGGFNTRQTRDAAGGTDVICLKCHQDKQGPFVFEHAPVRLEGCVICHSPHGSNNSRMLLRPRVMQLCLECHADTPGIAGPEPPAFHDIRNPRYQNCTTCHVKIHGSNVNRIFLQ
ncbi:MAG: DmsE family decaheme c-type cytochrome, partial [Acidobacteria bacterium]|nr:DmsE family decaheme c-type cytochrome [Acidobacteriota bacterium]